MVHAGYCLENEVALLSKAISHPVNTFMEDRLTAVPCVICARPVRLDECKVNDLGEPVHEGCLAERLKEEIKKRKAYN